MEIRNIKNPQITQFMQNKDNNSATSDVFKNFVSYKPITTETSKAYVSPQIKQIYQKVETFNLPYLGDGEVYELSNGHKFILIPKEGQTIIHTYVGVGELDEPSNLKGGSHLLEHLVGAYCANPKTDEVSNIISELGAECNAHTDSKYTGYYARASITNPDEFENLIKIQAQTLQNKNFSEKELEDEKKIIIQEMGSKELSIGDSTLAEKLTMQNLFKIKTLDSIPFEHIKKDDLTNYYNKFYRSDNMVTTVIGPIDKNAIKVIAKYFNNPVQQPKQPLRKPIPPNDFIQKSIRTDVESSDKITNKAYINMGFIGPKNTDDKETCNVSVLSWVINNRIKKNTTANTDIHSRFESTYADKTMPSFLSISGESDEKNIEDDLHTIHSIMEELRQNPISDEELENIKQEIKSDWSHFAEDSFMLSVVYTELGMLSENLDKSKEFEYIDIITPKDIQNTAKKYLDFDKSSTVVIHPKNSSAGEVSFKGLQDKFNNDDIKEYTLPNNLRVVIDSRLGIARSTIKFQLQSEKTLSPKDNVVITLALLRSLDDDKKRLQQKRIDIVEDVNAQGMFVSLNSDSDRTLEIVDNAVDILLKPNLSTSKFYTTKIMLERAHLKQNKSMEEKIEAEISGHSPYYTNIGTNPDMNMDDVKDFHKQILQNSQGTVFITIPKEKLQDNQDKILEKLSSVPDLKPYNYDKISAKSNPAPLAKTKVFLDPKDGEQVEIIKIFKLKDDGNVKDWATLLTLNMALGGNEKSKLYKQLRYEDKIAYNANSQVTNYQDHSIKLALSTKVSGKENGKNIKQAITVFDKSLDELATTPLTPKELKAAKGVMRSSMLSQLETSSLRNQMVSGGYNSSYGLNYNQALWDAIDNVTPEDVQVLAKNLCKQPYLLAVSGNKEAIKANRQYLSEFGEMVG